jgi:uncharacterized membrane protein YkvA (DUF1232 family)
MAMAARFLDDLKRRKNKLKAETYALYLAYKDPRVPWYAKLFIACAVGFAFSPIDLIPDFIPVLGYLDDLILVPIAIALAIRMVPRDVLADCRQKAQFEIDQKHPKNWVAASIIICIWLLFVLFAMFFVSRFLKDWFALVKWWLDRFLGS